MRRLITDSQMRFLQMLRDPRQKLLVVDAMGAAATCLATYFLLATEVIRTGLPPGLLCVMSLIAASFMAFDIAAVAGRFHPTTPLRIIACLNLSYCVLVLVSLYHYWHGITLLGIAYFSGEIAILVAVSLWEFRMANNGHSLN